MHSAPETVQVWAPLSGTRMGSVRSQARELYSTRSKAAPTAEDCTDAAHTEMLSSVQCCRLTLHRQKRRRHQQSSSRKTGLAS